MLPREGIDDVQCTGPTVVRLENSANCGAKRITDEWIEHEDNGGVVIERVVKNVAGQALNGSRLEVRPCQFNVSFGARHELLVEVDAHNPLEGKHRRDEKHLTLAASEVDEH